MFVPGGRHQWWTRANNGMVDTNTTTSQYRKVHTTHTDMTTRTQADWKIFATNLVRYLPTWMHYYAAGIAVTLEDDRPRLDNLGG